MKIEKPNAQPPSPEELKDLEKLKCLIEKAVADGVVSKDEMDSIKALMGADGKITTEELELCQKLIWDKIQTGQLEYGWKAN